MQLIHLTRQENHCFRNLSVPLRVAIWPLLSVRVYLVKQSFSVNQLRKLVVKRKFIRLQIFFFFFW